MRSELVPAVQAHPVLTNLPGSNVLQQLVNGAQAWALAIARSPPLTATYMAQLSRQKLKSWPARRLR